MTHTLIRKWVKLYIDRPSCKQGSSWPLKNSNGDPSVCCMHQNQDSPQFSFLQSISIGFHGRIILDIEKICQYSNNNNSLNYSMLIQINKHKCVLEMSSIQPVCVPIQKTLIASRIVSRS